jgi:hypothetical protein
VRETLGFKSGAGDFPKRGECPLVDPVRADPEFESGFGVHGVGTIKYVLAVLGESQRWVKSVTKAASTTRPHRV